jgi:hypothetical protein
MTNFSIKGWEILFSNRNFFRDFISLMIEKEGIKKKIQSKYIGRKLNMASNYK